MSERWRGIAWELFKPVLIALLVALLTGLRGGQGGPLPGQPLPAVGSQGVTNLDSLTLGEDLIVGDDASLGDDVRAAGYLITAGSALTLYNGDTITVTQTLMPLSGAEVVTTSATTAIAAPTSGLAVTGTLCILVNAGSNAITVKDSANTVLAGDVALGQGDALGVVWDGVDWVQLFTSNN